ncbi:MAG: BrnT family toxin [Tepidisphaerales bacterium]
MDFRWNVWNVGHIGEHGVIPPEAEYVVRHAKRPFPMDEGGGKWTVWGQTENGGYLQVVFVLDPDETIYVIHSRPLTDKEKRNLRRKWK